MEASETSTTCREEGMTTCIRTAVGRGHAQWMISLINVVVFNSFETTISRAIIENKNYVPSYWLDTNKKLKRNFTMTS